MQRAFSPIRKLRRRLLHNDAGATIVEFALILTPLLMVVLGGLDVAYRAYLQSVLQGALNDVARSATMEAPDLECDGDTVGAKISCAIRRRSDIVANQGTYEIEIRNFYDFSGIGRSEKLVTDYNHNGQYDPGDCFADLNRNGSFDEQAGRAGVGGADDVVFYRVALVMPRLFPVQGLLGLPDEYNIQAETAIRNQPYSRQMAPQTVCI